MIARHSYVNMPSRASTADQCSGRSANEPPVSAAPQHPLPTTPGSSAADKFLTQNDKSLKAATTCDVQRSRSHAAGDASGRETNTSGASGPANNASTMQPNDGQHSSFLSQHTHTRLTAFFPGLPRLAGTRKVKPIWILVKQETVRGSGISWAICKSALYLLQTDNHASIPPLSFLQAGCPSCRPTNSVKALKAVIVIVILIKLI